MTKGECWEIVENKRKKLNEAIRQYHGDVNHPDLKMDNAYLDRMVLEYMFYFDEKARTTLLKKPKMYLSLDEVKEIAREKNIAIESSDRKF